MDINEVLDKGVGLIVILVVALILGFAIMVSSASKWNDTSIGCMQRSDCFTQTSENITLSSAGEVFLTHLDILSTKQSVHNISNNLSIPASNYSINISTGGMFAVEEKLDGIEVNTSYAYYIGNPNTNIKNLRITVPIMIMAIFVLGIIAALVYFIKPFYQE